MRLVARSAWLHAHKLQHESRKAHLGNDKANSSVHMVTLILEHSRGKKDRPCVSPSLDDDTQILLGNQHLFGQGLYSDVGGS